MDLNPDQENAPNKNVNNIADLLAVKTACYQHFSWQWWIHISDEHRYLGHNMAYDSREMILINNSHVLSICKSLKHFQDIKDQIIMATEEKKVAGIGLFGKLKTNTMVKS